MKFIKQYRPAVLHVDFALIPLNRNAEKGYAVVDLDYAWVDKYTWSYNRGYAVAKIDGKQEPLHRLVMNFPADKLVDHKNGNGLDNRKSNLRVCTRTENRRNSTRSKLNTTGFKLGSGGVSTRWGYTARLGHLGKKLYLGTYETTIEAARAYEDKALELHGEFARLNLKEQKD